MGALEISRLTESAVVLPLTSDEEIAGAWAVMRQLRPELTHDAYCTRAKQLMAGDGYRLLAVTTLGSVRAVAGYRIKNNLDGGRMLVVEDFVCDLPHRCKGRGSLLIRALKVIAAERLCTGMQLAVADLLNEQVLRFFLGNGFGITAVEMHLAVAHPDGDRTGSDAP